MRSTEGRHLRRSASAGIGELGAITMAALLLSACSGNPVTPPPNWADAVCPDNYVDPGETCDGNSEVCTTPAGYAGTRACLPDCSGFGTCTSTEVCGDGTVNGGEICDEGPLNGTAPDRCSATCTPGSAAMCGNGIPEAGEPCDGGGRTCTNMQGYPGEQACNPTCTGFQPCASTLFCGDGTCTPGAENQGSCPGDCQTMPVCGNGQREPGEQCDDGNTTGGDGCSGSCTVEPGTGNDRTIEQGVVIRVQGESGGNIRTNLIDDNINTAWRDDAGQSWIEIDFTNTTAGAFTIHSYTFTSGGDAGGDPIYWGLIATANGADWDRLEDGSADFTARGQKLEFQIPNPASYRIYRFDLGSRNGAFTQIAEIEMLEAGAAVCGNGRIDAGETCDGDARSCTAGNGYPGSENCNGNCDGYSACSTNLFCGDGACTPGPENSTSCPGDCPVTNYPPPPVYSGTCPVLTHGNNAGFSSGGQSRAFELMLPPNPVGAPVVFAWHALGATPQDAMSWGGLDVLYQQENFVIVAPYSCCASEWVIGGNPATNPDLAIFDDVLACLNTQYGVDLDRIYSTGFSAGGLYTSYLLQQRSGHLASTVPFSGGLIGNYTQPNFQMPVMFVWGGPNDLYGNFSFEQSTLALSNALRNDGHFIVHCSGNFGHTQPSEAGPMTWRFLEDHPRGVAPEPYVGGLPGQLPGYCNIAP